MGTREWEVLASGHTAVRWSLGLEPSVLIRRQGLSDADTSYNLPQSILGTSHTHKVRQFSQQPWERCSYCPHFTDKENIEIQSGLLVPGHRA